MDFSQTKSFKSQGSYRQTKKNHEELPILSGHKCSDHEDNGMDERTVNAAERPEVIVKMDGGGDTSSDSSSSGGRKNRRELSFESMLLKETEFHDPPSMLINQFLNKQKAEGGDITLDMDMEMKELRPVQSFPPSAESSIVKPSSKEIRVSFDPSISSSDFQSATESLRRRYKDLQADAGGNISKRDRALRSTSSAAFHKEARKLSRLKTKSRLLDPPEEKERMSAAGRSAKSGPLKSGMMSRIEDSEEEEDPFADEDLPDEFKGSRVNTMTVLQWLSLIAITAALICSLSIKTLKEQRFLKLKLWRWKVLLLVLICGKLVSGWGVRIVVFFIERNFLLRKRVLYFVYSLRKAVQNCLWLGLVLLAWHFLLDKKVEKEAKTGFLKYVTRILVCFLVANFIWLLKTLMVKTLASSFHVSTYFDRIQESIFNQYVIETLSGPPLIEIQRNEEDAQQTVDEVQELQNAGAFVPPELKAAVFSGAKSGRVSSSNGINSRSSKGKNFRISGQLSSSKSINEDKGITIHHLNKLNIKNVSAWNMKRLMKIVKHGTLSTLDEQILGAATEDEYATHIRTEYQAKGAARKIFYNVARPGSKYIYLEDLMRFMREDEAWRAMNCFEGACESSKISKAALKNWVVNAFRERRALSLTLNDTKTAVNKLHQMVNFIVGIIIIVIWLVILEIATSKFLFFLGSQLVVVSFIFGNTAKTLFESNIFLFIIHPYDVGDRCEVDGIQLIVEEMNILTTVFLRADNQRIIYPNTILATKSIGNFYRSPDMGDAIEFCVHICTPTEKIALMRQKIISYIENKKEHWYPGPAVVLKEVEMLYRLRMAVWFRHRMNHQDMGERFERRALLLEEIVKILKDLDIQYRLHPLDVNIPSIPETAPSVLPDLPLT